VAIQKVKAAVDLAVTECVSKARERIRIRDLVFSILGALDAALGEVHELRGQVKQLEREVKRLGEGWESGAARSRNSSCCDRSERGKEWPVSAFARTRKRTKL
jgi:hypothetical protein